MKLPRNLNAARKHDVVVECRAGHEQQARRQHERQREPFLLAVQPRRDEQPHLPHHRRRGDDDAGQHRDLEAQHERLGRFGVDHRAARRQRGCQRTHDEVEDAIQEDEGDQKAYAHADERPDDAFPELVEVLEKRHLGTGSVEVSFLIVRIDRCPGRVLGAGEGYERHGDRRQAPVSAFRATGSSCSHGRRGSRDGVERRPGA